MSELFNEIKESLTMQQVAEHFGYKVNRSGFILSPFRNEKTPSCKLYRNSYYDFSTAAGGDLVQFTATINGSNNWQACQYLIEAFPCLIPYQVTQITGSKYAAGSRRNSGSRRKNSGSKRHGGQKWTGLRLGRTFIREPLKKRYSRLCPICRRSRWQSYKRYLTSWLCFAYMVVGGSRRKF